MTMLLKRKTFVAVMVSLLISATSGFAQMARPAAPATSASGQPSKLQVDASHAPEKILHATEQIPVAPGSLTLVFPKWIPGEHGPTGPIVDLTGLQFSAKGQRLTWRRDLVEMYSIQLTATEGTSTLEGRLERVRPAPPEGFSSGASATTQLDLLSWNQVVLYPYTPGKNTDDILVTPTLKLPGGWHYDTALQVSGEGGGNEVTFQTVSLTTLVDSPVLAGAHFRRIPLTPDGPIQHSVDIAAATEPALQPPPELVNSYNRLVAETGALFGARLYREYHFLVTFIYHTAHYHLEHP